MKKGRKKSHRRKRRKSHKRKGTIPLAILVKRHAKLGAIIKRRRK